VNAFKPGFNNEYVPVNTYLAYAAGPPEADGQRQTIRQFACKNPGCDRFACTASAEWCSCYCCPACAAGGGHTTDCNTHIAEMRARLVPGAPVIDSEEYGRELRAQMTGRRFGA
jgi:hypothetical protein